MSWPGTSYDVDACQAAYTQTLTDAAKELDVELELNPTGLSDPEDVSSFVEHLRQSPVDGLFVSVMDLQHWPQVDYLVKNRGEIPLIVFSPLGTSFAKHHQICRSTPSTFLAATDDAEWPAFGMRMLKTVWEMKNSRICVLWGDKAEDRILEPIGTTIRFLPLARWKEELERTPMTEEIREIAKSYGIQAEDVVEPDTEDLLAASKNYVVARRIMASEDCRGISVDCARLIGEKQVACGTCLAWSRLLDEGLVGACEADVNAAVSMLLTGLLFQRPAFMQDPAPNTVNKTLIASHCTCCTKLDGYDQPPHRFALRSHYESNSGVALQVFWREGQPVTLMKLLDPGHMVIATGEVVRNVEAKHMGGCRTAIEIRLDDDTDPRNLKGHHQLVMYGKLDAPLDAYCRLADIEVSHA